jgi:glucosamine--fructose-6-phosphate aminotransferase (isomerizing)
MCGIVAAVSARANVVPILINGLRKLEYRGYDSAGVAVLQGGKMARVRTAGRVAELATVAEGLVAATGIAHTRWATHGAPCERNAHPHVSGRVAVVHNGIIENHEALRRQLMAEGFEFSSDTDTETIAHLIAARLRHAATLLDAVRAAVQGLEGAYAIAVVDEAAPDAVVVARHGSPLVLGRVGDGPNAGWYAASDTAALLQITRDIVYLENGDVAELSQAGPRIVQADGAPVHRPLVVSQLTADAVELGSYRHYMQKEIFEQPQAVANTLGLVGHARRVHPEIFGTLAPSLLRGVRKVLILACGTSYHAASTARYWIESLARLPCEVEIASEYRYRASVPRPDQLVVAVSQSGETADTLAALQHAKALGHSRTLAICNVPESAIVREAALRFITRAGPEIGVASTKAFTTQLVALFLLTLALGRLNGRLADADEQASLARLRSLPEALSAVLALEPHIERWAQTLADKRHALFLGRGKHWPIALEGALKLKEISYLHAEAYAAGELKHGPLALVDAEMPVIAVAPSDALLDKLRSNLQEVRARGGQLYVLTDALSHFDATEGVRVLRLPADYGELSPIAHVLPLQMLAYHTALVKGTDVDKPRNLAKSVTVE